MTLERNLLIEAGAGTGKTTRLVKSVLQALFIRQIPLESIVALTFTNKAAGELKERVGMALEDVLSAQSIDDLRKKPWWPDPAPILPLTDLQILARAATGVLDRANISTIHSFAFAILKRFPLAAGIDPNASIDDKKLRFDALFREEWPRWLAVELAETPPREAQWLELLAQLGLMEVEEAARNLSDFEVPLDKVRISDTELPKRLKPYHEEIKKLLGSHPGNNKADLVARACEEVIGLHASNKSSSPVATNSSSPAVSGGGSMDSPPVAVGNDVRSVLLSKPGKTIAWSPEDFERLRLIQLVARNLMASGDHTISLLTEILEPFLHLFRRRLLTEGCLTHAALLYLSREVVKNKVDIREALKRDIGLILIDEFQDTDPLQAELLLYLAEKPGHHANSWDRVQLAPGKLFIVGDPKQSIYRFRGADIAAYERIGKLVVEQGGFQETLEVNYRSQAQVIHIVNQAFKTIIRPEPEISPPYVAVAPHHPKDPAHAVQDVEVWLADSADEQSVEDAQATEAEHIARWIQEQVGHMTVHDARDNARRPMLYRDVSLIFRTYSPMDRYVEALRRNGIPFAVESERYFFTTPEVTDFINLLRAADNPEDTLSLVGFLRGQLGGQTDDEILRRKNAGSLEELEKVRWLRTITARLGRQPLAEVLQSIFEESWLLELAARSYHGDQTVANLIKLRRLLEEFAAEGLTTMGLLLKKLEEFFADDTIEGESPLADENYNAVRLLTIHKAKGLEYPVVFLPSLHSGLRAHPAQACVYDWRTQKLGLKVGGFCNLDKLELDAQTQRREAAEQNRILYVAMTRARERLVLSGGIHLKTSSSNTYFQRLLESLGHSLENLKEGEIALENASITVRKLDRVTIHEGEQKADTGNPLTRIDPKHFADVWKKRALVAAQAQQSALVITPSSASKHRRNGVSERSDFAEAPYLRPSDAQHVGTLVHRFLEQWDFTCEKCSMPAKLRQAANSYFAGLGMLESPLPDPKMSGSECASTHIMRKIIDIVDESQSILANFIGSEAWEEIKNAEIIAREMPFFYTMPRGAGEPESRSNQPAPTPRISDAPTPPLMRGTMDIVYRKPDGQLIIGDYKTDKVLDPSRYAGQAKAYKDAIQLTLGEIAQFKLIHLREGNAIIA